MLIRNPRTEISLENLSFHVILGFVVKFPDLMDELLANIHS